MVLERYETVEDHIKMCYYTYHVHNCRCISRISASFRFYFPKNSVDKLLCASPQGLFFLNIYLPQSTAQLASRSWSTRRMCGTILWIRFLFPEFLSWCWHQLDSVANLITMFQTLLINSFHPSWNSTKFYVHFLLPYRTNMEKQSFPNKMICKWSRNIIFILHRTRHIYVHVNFMTGFMVYNLYIYNQSPKKYKWTNYLCCVK